MNFTNVKAITIPEGPVSKILRGAEVLWEKLTSLLPAEYQQVEWIKGSIASTSSGTLIDLGFSFDTAATIYLVFDDSENKDACGYFFGAAENSGKYRCMITGNANTYTAYGSNGSAYLGVTSPTPKAEVSIVYNLSAGNLSLENRYTGTLKTNTTNAAFTMTNNLYLFAQNYNGTARVGGHKTKLKRFQYYDKNGVLICNLVPCYRKSDGVVGAYDIARQTFLSSTGANSFSKGADVT